MTKHDQDDYEFDVCLSFAGQDRVYVRKVAEELRLIGIRVFYDEYEEVDLWGKDLYEHLDDVYKNAARYCVLFVSKHYASKIWTNHERKSAQERALKNSSEYILPARFDDTVVPGLRDTVGYIDLRNRSEKELSKLIQEKIGGHFRSNYLPPIPDKLFEELDVENVEDTNYVLGSAHKLLSSLKRMTEEERELIFHFFLHACPAELPDNVHINIDLLRRISGFTPSKIKRMLEKLQSLGFFTSLREDTETQGRLGKNEMLVLEWHDMNLYGRVGTTGVANAMMIGATSGYCEHHALEALKRLDFSQLSEATTVIDDHSSDESVHS